MPTHSAGHFRLEMHSLRSRAAPVHVSRGRFPLMRPRWVVASTSQERPPEDMREERFYNWRTFEYESELSYSFGTL